MLAPVSAGSANGLTRVPGDNVLCGGEGFRYQKGAGVICSGLGGLSIGYRNHGIGIGIRPCDKR